ncbi:MAG: hypothetical protein M1827_007574 [Pycnora praestabilis]|nr:MAG: hypothetical protein M1827_007574 [Pycnora praestabilis]
MVAVFLKLHLDRSTIKQKLKRIDWVGTAWFMGSTTSILIPLSWGGVVYPWNHWRTLVPLLLGVAGLLILVYWELHVAVEASLRLSIFRTWTAKVTFLTTFLHGFIIFLQLYYLPLYFEAVKGYSPVISGLAVFPQTLTVAPSALIVGILISVTGSYRWLLRIGWALTTLGLGLMYLLDVHTSTPAWIFLNMTSGLGLGTLYPAMAFAIQASVQNEDIAFAVAAYSFFRSFGSAFGVAIGGVTFQNVLKKKLLAYPLLALDAAAYSKDSPTLVQIIKGMDGHPDEKAQLIQAFADSLKVIWLLACGVSGIALMVSFVIKDYSLDVVLKTQQGLVREMEDMNMEEHASESSLSTLVPPTLS